MAIHAIPTWYHGCYFRSRLEARWAVFFDTLGIRWQYEAQGYECTWRLNCDYSTFPYLPDFWLPDLALHAEVKGALTVSECDRLFNAAACLSSSGEGCGHEAGGFDLAVFGNIPDPELPLLRQPPVLHMHKGTLFATPLFSEHDRCKTVRPVASDNGDPWMQWKDDSAYAKHGSRERHAINMLLVGVIDERALLAPEPAYQAHLKLMERLRHGYTAARSARFEHGESGSQL